MPRPALMVFALAGVLIFGCKIGSSARSAAESVRSSLNPPAAPPDTIPEMLEYAADLGVNISEMAKLPEGVLWLDLVPGDGQPAAPGDSVEIGMQVWLPNGSRVDSTVTAVRLGSGQVIDGVELAVPGMKPGGRRQLVIPPGLAYGSQGREGVPPDAVLVYVVELRSVVR
ncbi:MAG TPA: FKBP-type peptidyl-prolyl cis-trans isomerase [Gemmatimonadales bacterium]|nr:FKBP-type peptidyl-prolyl cis-trans isomerase [Gemmatimonadales bacterium]